MKLIKEANLSIHPRAIEAMGADLVTDDNIAILELIKNSYDAFAYNVCLEIGEGNAFIKISDDGLGMSLEDILNSWSKISTTYKKENTEVTRDGKTRIVSGNKGLGRLSAARLGKTLTIITKQKNKAAYMARFDWEGFYTKDKTDDCKFNIYEINDWNEISEIPIKDCGTRLIIEQLNSNWMPENFGKKTRDNAKYICLKVELERLLDPFSLNDFVIKLKYPNKKSTIFNYLDESECLVSHPLINNPPYKVKGKVDKDQNVSYEYTYIDNFKDISKREAHPKNLTISWEEIKKRCDSSLETIPYHEDVKCGQFEFEIRVWDLDNDSLSKIYEEHKNSLASTKTVREIIANHKGISVYRDGILVLPKSETSKDWLGLDKKRIGRVGSNLSTSQIIGKIDITLKNNPNIQDTSSRETFNKTKEFDNFFAICTKGIIYDIQQLRTIEKKTNNLTVKDFFADASPKILQNEVSKAVKENKNPEEIKTIVDQYSSRLSANLKELQERVEYYAQLASAGTFSKIIIHEIRNNINPVQRFNRNVFQQYSPLKDNIFKYYTQSEEGCKRLMDLSDAFAPLSRTTFKKEKHSSMLYSQINNVEILMQDYFKDAKIRFINNSLKGIAISLHPGEIQTILINLIDNAIYWLQKVDNLEKIIVVATRVSESNIIVSISDNGPGVQEDLGDAIFKPGVTCKPNGFGMGLVVVNEIVASHGGYLKSIQPGDLGGATFEFSVPILK